MVTTIQLEERTKQKLENMKVFPRESYNQVIVRLINTNDEDMELSEETIKDIEEALRDVKVGRVYTTREVKKELGIK